MRREPAVAPAPRFWWSCQGVQGFQRLAAYSFALKLCCGARKGNRAFLEPGGRRKVLPLGPALERASPRPPIRLWGDYKTAKQPRPTQTADDLPSAMQLPPGAPSVRPAATTQRTSPLATFDLQVSMEKFAASHGQNPETFLRIIDSAKDLYGWSDAQTLAYAGLNLKGRALSWYNNQEPMNWTAFKTALIDRFGIDPSKMLGALTKRVQGETESVRDYADALRTLVRHSRDPHLPSTLQHFFISGLRGDLQSFVKARRPETFEAAVAEGEYYEAEFGGTAGRAAAGSNEAAAAPPLPSATIGRVLRERNAGDPVESIRRQLEKVSLQLRDIRGSLALACVPDCGKLGRFELAVGASDPACYLEMEPATSDNWADDPDPRPSADSDTDDTPDIPHDPGASSLASGTTTDVDSDSDSDIG